MIITLSPAKLINFETPVSIKEKTAPQFIEQTNELMGILKKLPVVEIGSLMKINHQQTITVYQQIQAFDFDKTPQKQAGFTYNGIAYSGLNIRSFSKAEIDYAQKHLVILSGLYGALRPLDMIKPYRLEMQAELENGNGTNLYAFWNKTLTKYLSGCLSGDDKIWLNLMSNEYTKVITRKDLPKGTKIVTPVFKQQAANGYRQVVVYTKKARGMMARFALKNKITDITHLKAFDEEGYTYSEQLSKGDNWVFIR